MISLNPAQEAPTKALSPLAIPFEILSKALTYNKGQPDICSIKVIELLLECDKIVTEFHYNIDSFSKDQVKRAITRLIKQNLIDLQLRNTDPNNHHQRSTFLALNVPVLLELAREERGLRWACDSYTRDHHQIVCGWAKRYDICYEAAKCILERMICKGWKPLFSTMKKFLSYMAKVIRGEKNTVPYLKSIVNKPLSSLRAFWLKMKTQGIYKMTMLLNIENSGSKEKENKTKEKERLTDEEMLHKILGKPRKPIDILGYLTDEKCRELCKLAGRHNSNWKWVLDYTPMAARGLVTYLQDKRKQEGHKPWIYNSTREIETYVIGRLRDERRPNWALEKYDVTHQKFLKNLREAEQDWQKTKTQDYYPPRIRKAAESTKIGEVNYLTSAVPDEQERLYSLPNHFSGLLGNVLSNIGKKVYPSAKKGIQST